MSNKNARLRNYLKSTLQAQPNSLRGEIAREALEYDGDIPTFFNDLLQHGCQSGFIGKLIYYCDTHRFYDTYYEEIEVLRIDLEESVGMPLHPQGDLKNWYAWLAFEETARIIAQQLLISSY